MLFGGGYHCRGPQMLGQKNPVPFFDLLWEILVGHGDTLADTLNGRIGQNKVIARFETQAGPTDCAHPDFRAAKILQNRHRLACLL